MQQLIKKLSEYSIVRYIVMGGSSFAIEICILYFIATILDFGATVGVAISFWIGLGISFVLQKFFAFQNNSTEKKLVFRQIIIYSSLIAFNYVFTLSYMNALEPVVGLFFARITALLLTTSWNFIIYSKLLFKEPAAENE